MDKWKYKVRYDLNDEIWLKIGVTSIDEKMESLEMVLSLFWEEQLLH